MLSTAIIVFREVLEAALIIGIVLSATQGVIHRERWIRYGVGTGLLGACIVAFFAEFIAGAVEGMGQEIFNAGVLLAATAMLAWHNLWMARHGRELAMRMKNIGQGVSENSQPMYMLTVVIALAVLREGSEVVLFVYGIAAAGAQGIPMLAGGFLGIVMGVAVGIALYLGLIRIPARYLFTTTAWLIVLLAAGMASQAAGFLIQAGLLPAIKPVLWDSSAILSEHSMLGEVLHTLIGYEDRPAAMQFIVYLAAISIIGTMTMMAKGPLSPKVASSMAVFIFSLVIVTIVMLPKPASAAHKVYYPTVELGETEIELRAHVTNDDDAFLDNEQKYKLGVGKGFNSYWFSELYAEIEKPAGEDAYELESFEWENLFQLTEQGKYWADWGFLVEYSLARESEYPDKIELTPIMQKELGRHLYTLNLTLEREFGDNAEDEWELGYAMQFKWMGEQTMEFGVELFGELGEATDWNSSSDQVHEAGPVMMGKIKTGTGTAWKYQLGILFGLTTPTPEATLAGQLEYEF